MRRWGIRYADAGVETEMLWNEIVDVEVSRTDDTDMGLVSVETRSSDGVSPSGPLTKTEWVVTIHAADGRSIQLGRMFMRMVPDRDKYDKKWKKHALRRNNYSTAQ